MTKPLITEQFEHQFIPASGRVPRSQQKLMVVLHGRGDHLKSFRSLPEELDLPQMNYLLLNAPRRYAGGYTWYAFEPNQRTGVLKARAKLFNLMDELEAQGWNSRDVFLYGFSQGALVSCDFGLNFPKVLGGIIAISGYVYFFPDWKKQLTSHAFHTPWLITHGAYDDAIDVRLAQESVARLHSVGLPVQYFELAKGHEIDDEEETPLIRRWLQTRLKIGPIRHPVQVVSAQMLKAAKQRPTLHP